MKHVYTLAIIIAGFLLSPAAWGQNDNHAKKDSLRKVIANAEGEAKIKAWGPLIVHLFHYEHNPDSIVKYFEAAELEAVRQGNMEAAGKAKKNLLAKLNNEGMYEQLIERAGDALKFLAENEQWNRYYEIYRKVIFAYFRTGEKDKALEVAQQLYETSKRDNHSQGIQAALFCSGYIYANTERREEAESMFRQCLEEAEKTDEITEMKIGCYYYIVNMNNSLHKTNDTEELFGKWENDIKKLEKDGQPVITYWNNYKVMKLNFYVMTENWDKVAEYCDMLENSEYALNDIGLVYEARIKMYNTRKDWANALVYANKYYEISEKNSITQNRLIALRYQVNSLYSMGKQEEGWEAFNHFELLKDSIANKDFAAQLDDIRTQYEVDKHILEKERNRDYFFFALGGCLLLAVALGIYIYYNRKIARKNRIMAGQIKELQVQQNLRDEELLRKTTFGPVESPDDEGFCPESRRDKLCIAIRDMILREKAYRNPVLSREQVIEQLGTNRQLFDEAVQYCFCMSFTDYVNTLRMKDAITLLEQSDLPVEAVAEKAGYGTLRTFQRQFGKQYNMSPKEYRKFSAENKA
jgi:AraC-like DNA-binding protein